jgi:DNA polymerase-1
MPYSNQIVYLVDGTSYLYRAYHAIRHLSNSKGFPTNAIFGLTKMILKLLEDKKPTYIAIVFDAKGPTFRHNIYKEYKANRPPMPEDLAVQIPIVKEVLEKLGLKIIEKEGYEADDIIGTLARMGEEDGYRVVMVTGDKDFRQVITPGVSMWDSMRDKIVEYETLKNESGFEPEKFIDVMGLAGDSTDNIPGVPGIGEKTAINLVNQYGSFEEVFNRLEEMKGTKLKENLKKSQGIAELSKKLVTIERFVPLEEKIEDLKLCEYSGKELGEIFRTLEFRDLWEQFAAVENETGEYKLCLSLDMLSDFVEKVKNKGIVSIDTETTGLNPLKAGLVGIALTCEEGTGIYLPVAHDYPGVPLQLAWSEVQTILKEIFENESIKKVGQNVKYDAHVLKRCGSNLEGIYFDTMIASYVINPGLRQHNLDYLAQHYLNYKMISYHDVVGKGKNERTFAEIPLEEAMVYSCEDADITLRLMNKMADTLKDDGNEELFYNLEMTLIPVLMDMEASGILIDRGLFKALSSRFLSLIRDLEKDIFAEVGMEFNINSPKQLAHVLFEKLGLPAQGKTTKTKSQSTDVKALRKLAALPHNVPAMVLRYRTISKLKSTYVDAMLDMADSSTGRIHTSFNQTVTATGRLSSSNPNLQNIPIRGEEGREIRKGFIASDGHYLVSADYSQIELRVFAHYSNDEAFIEAFKTDKDIHSRTAAEILGVSNLEVNQEMRRIAKAINFGIIYGMGPRKLSEELGIDIKTAKNYIESYYKKYSGLAKYREETIGFARERGYVTTLFGRKRYLPDIRHDNRMVQANAERMAVNTTIQGTAADLIKKAMINIHERIRNERLESKMILQVHDELVFEVPEKELEVIVPLIKHEMERVYSLKVPLKVEIGKGQNWDEAH